MDRPINRLGENPMQGRGFVGGRRKCWESVVSHDGTVYTSAGPVYEKRMGRIEFFPSFDAGLSRYGAKLKMTRTQKKPNDDEPRRDHTGPCETRFDEQVAAV